MVVSFSPLTTHYSPSPNNPFDGAKIICGGRGTICNAHGGEAWSFARRLKQQEMTNRAPFAATYGTFRPGLDVLLIHLSEATMSPFPVNPRWYDEYWMTERRPRLLRLAAALRRLRRSG